MSFQAFDRTELDQYAQEIKERWGDTVAYAESREKLRGKTKEEVDAMGVELMDIFARLGRLRGQEADSPEAQALVTELQVFISSHYYHCTDEILAGLGEMYVADERMRTNIDRSGGEGTAAFAARAIRAHIKK